MANKATITESKDQRSVIMQEAAKLFFQKGYHAATMDDLAEAVRLNKATVYYYFKSKANLLFEIIHTSQEEVLTMIQAAPSEIAPEDQLRQFIVDTVLFLAQHRVEAGVFFQEESYLDQWLSETQVEMIRSRQRKWEDLAESIVRNGQKHGAFDADLDCWVVAEVFLGMMHWFLRQNRRTSTKLPPRVVAEQWAQVILRGVVPRG